MCNANYNVHLVKSTNSTWSLVLLACLVTLIALLFLISKFWTMSTVKNNSKTTLNKDVLVSTNQEKLLFPLLPSNTVNMNGYVIEEILHSGRFATNYTLTGNVQLWFTCEFYIAKKIMTLILFKEHRGKMIKVHKNWSWRNILGLTRSFFSPQKSKYMNFWKAFNVHLFWTFMADTMKSPLMLSFIAIFSPWSMCQEPWIKWCSRQSSIGVD